jgi:hypothetical protein
MANRCTAAQPTLSAPFVALLLLLLLRAQRPPGFSAVDVTGDDTGIEMQEDVTEIKEDVTELELRGRRRSGSPHDRLRRRSSSQRRRRSSSPSSKGSAL